MKQEHLEILTNIIGAVESGGQIYGNRNYAAYAGAGQNSENEKTCTLGWAQNYGSEGQKLCRMILEKDADAFRRADTAGIESRLKEDWVGLQWNPSESEKKALIAIITIEAGKTCQDELFRQLMEQYSMEAEAYGVTTPPAQMMWCEIQHVGGAEPVRRIFSRASRPYTPDSIFKALLMDQNDTGNDNQVGDRIFQSRHECCVRWIKQYVNDEQREENAVNSIQKLLELAESQVSYPEKNDTENLDSFTAAGSGNYTKFARDLTAMGLMGCQGQAWCGVYQMWLDCQVFGKESALDHLGSKFYNCFATRDWAKATGRWLDRTGEPKPGYRVIFSQSHIALVTRVTAGKIYTNEGNTSEGTGVSRDGGRVCNKVYDRSYNKILGYVKIEYGQAGAAEITNKYEIYTTGLTVTAKTLNIRKEPKTGTQTGTYTFGEKVFPTMKAFAGSDAWFLSDKGWISGKYLSGWVQELSDAGKRWWYLETDYTYLAAVVKPIDGKLFAFDPDGWMITADRISENGQIV